MAEEINDPNIITFVSLDFKGSTDLLKDLPKDKSVQIMQNSRNSVEDTFSVFNAEPKPYSWQGDGIYFYFKNYEGINNAIAASLQTVEKFLTEKISIRISAGADKFNLDNNNAVIQYGKLDSLEFSKAGHLNKICPPNSVVITENIFNNLNKKLQEKFVFSGTTSRDNTPFYISPANYKNKINKHEIIPEKDDINFEINEYLQYFDSPEIIKVRFVGIRQFNRIGELDIMDIFTEPDVQYKISVSRTLEKRRNYINSELDSSVTNLSVNLNFDGTSLSSPALVDSGPVSDSKIFIPVLKGLNFSETIQPSLASAVSGQINSEDLQSMRNYNIEKSFQQEEIKQRFSVIFNKYKHIVILGDPGSGKTTLLKWIGVIAKNGEFKTKKYLNANEELLPVIASIGKLYSIYKDKKSNIEFIETIGIYLKGSNFPLSVKNIKKIFDSKNCIFLLDGLDEIPDESDRIKAVKWIEQILFRYQKHRFIITSRIAGFSGFVVGSESCICNLSPFNKEQIKKFTAKFYEAFERKESNDELYIKNIAEKNCRSFFESLEKNYMLQNFVKNPLLLAITALIQRQGLRLPDYRIQLYELCARTLIKTWSEIRKISNSPKKTSSMNFEKEALKIFPAIAYELHKNYSSNLIPEKELKKLLAETLNKISESSEEVEKSIDNFLDKMKNEIQLFLPRGIDEWGFMHQTFQEYFTTIYLSNLKNYSDEIKQYLFNPRWEEVIKMFASNLSVIYHRDWETEDFLNVILNAKDGLNTELLNKHIFLAAKCLAETSGVSKDIENNIFDEIKKLFFQEEEFWIYKISELCLEIKGSNLYYKILKLMIDCVESENKQPHYSTVIYCLGEIRDESAVETLIKLLVKYSKNHGIAFNIAEALLKINNNETAYKYLEIGINDTADYRQADFFKLFLKYNCEKYVDLLISKAKESEISLTNLVNVINALEKLDNKKLFDFLFDSFQQADLFTSRHYIENLSEFIGKSADENIVNYLIENAKSQNHPFSIRAKSIIALGETKNEKVMDLLLSIYKNKKEDNEIRKYALISIAKIDVNIAIGVFNKLPLPVFIISDSFYYDYIENLKDINLLKKICANYKSKSFPFYQIDKFIIAFGKIGGAKAIEFLLKIISDDFEFIYTLVHDPLSKAARELGKIGDKKIIPNLIKIYKKSDKILNNDDRTAVRSAILEAVWNLINK